MYVVHDLSWFFSSYNLRILLSSSLDCQVQLFYLRQTTKVARNDLAKRLSWTSQRTLRSIVATSHSFAVVTSDTCAVWMGVKPLLMRTTFGPYSGTGWTLLREMSLCISQAFMCCWLYPRDGRKTQVPFLFTKDVVICASTGENSSWPCWIAFSK